YAAHKSQWMPQNPQPVPANQPKNTFFRHNAVEAADPDPVTGQPPSPATPGQTLKLPFDWLVHLDRPVVSPPELLQVSGFRPHELTQQFMLTNALTIPPPPPNPNERFAHRAPWYDQSARIYRMFEFWDAGHRYQGIGNTRDGRIPGKLNICTMWDPEPLLAVCD